MTEPELLPVDRSTVHRLRRQVDGFARGSGVDAQTTWQIVEKVAPADLQGSAFGIFGLLTGMAVRAGNVAAGPIWDAYGS